MSFISPNPQILLEPAEWAWATWRTRQPLPRPEASPFDRADALQRLKKIRRLKSGRWDWSKVDTPMMRSSQEAIFWYQAFTTALKFVQVKEFLAACQEPIISIAPSTEDFSNWIQHTDRRQIDPQILKPLSYFFTPSQLLDWAVEKNDWGRGWLRNWFLQGIQYFVLPYLTDAEIAVVRENIRATWHQWDLDRHLDLLILFGLHPEMQQIVENLQPTRNQQYWWTAVAIFGLESAEQVLYYGRKFKLRFNRRNQVYAWLANTELAGLEIIYQSIAAIDNNKERAAAHEMFYALSLTVPSPTIAPHVFALMEKSRVVGLAEDWLTTNTSLAIEGLLPQAIDNSRICAWLKLVARQGHRQQIEMTMQKISASDYQELAEKILDLELAIPPSNTPQLFTKLPNILQPKVDEEMATFDWIKASDLPRITIDNIPISLEQQQIVLNLIYDEDIDLQPLVAAVDRQSLSDFIYEFLICGELKKEHYSCRRVLRKLANCADDRAVSTIMYLMQVDSWSAKNVETCLTALATIGGNLAILELMKLLYLEGNIPNVAATLTSMVAPRGIDNFTIPNSLLVYTEENRWRMEQHALDYFISIATNKRELTSLLKLQNRRLESQMLDGTPISRESFQACLASPIFAPLFQQLVWAGYQRDGNKTCLRITEDFTFADMHDNLLTVKPESFVFFSLPHPLSLSAPELLAWQNLLSDYKIMQPFEQLNRSIYIANLEDSIYTDFRDRSVFSLKLTSSLKKAGWQSHSDLRGNWQDFTKTYVDSHITAVVRTARTTQEYTNRYVDRIFFIDGNPNQLDVSHSKGAVEFAAVPVIFFSEVLRAIDIILKPKNSG
jgi:Domain of unknown function (DUF4132)